MTLNCYKFKFFRNFALLRIFWARLSRSYLCVGQAFLYIFRVSKRLYRWFRRVKYGNSFRKLLVKLVFLVSQKPFQDSVKSHQLRDAMDPNFSRGRYPKQPLTRALGTLYGRTTCQKPTTAMWNGRRHNVSLCSHLQYNFLLTCTIHLA